MTATRSSAQRIDNIHAHLAREGIPGGYRYDAGLPRSTRGQSAGDGLVQTTHHYVIDTHDGNVAVTHGGGNPGLDPGPGRSVGPPPPQDPGIARRTARLRQPIM